MALNQAQLMEVPGGPGNVGSVKQRSDFSISPDGTISIDPSQTVTRVIAGAGVTINPTSGFGDVSISTTLVLNDPFPSNKTTFFCQSSAPTGWTQNVNNANSTLRIVNSSPSTGGSVSVSSLFTSLPVTGTASGSNFSTSLTLQTASIPVAGSVNSVSGSVSGTTLDQNTGGSHVHGYFYTPYGTVFSLGGANPQNNPGPDQNGYRSEGPNQGSGQAHNHAFDSGSGTFTGTNIDHNHTASVATTATFGNFSGGSINLAVKYVDLITAFKN